MNRVELIGIVGSDPVYKTDNNVRYARFTLATTERWRDSSGKNQQATDWHHIVGWGKTAELLQQYLVKGTLVLIIGKLKTRTYLKEGFTRSITEINVESFQVCR